jgi:chromosome segregation ATPase
MTISEALLTVILLLGIATLTISFYALRSSRRSEGLGEDRYELLRDQHDRLTLLREERGMLVEVLERESQERRQLMESLKAASPQLVDDLEQFRQESVENARRADEQQEQERLRLEQELQRLEQELEQVSDERSRIQQKAEGAAHDLQQLKGDLESEKDKRQEAQRGAEQLEQERLRMKRELDRSKEESEGRGPKARPWWRRPVLVVGMLLGALAAWFTSLIVALNLLSP